VKAENETKRNTKGGNAHLGRRALSCDGRTPTEVPNNRNSRGQSRVREHRVQKGRTKDKTDKKTGGGFG